MYLICSCTVDSIVIITTTYRPELAFAGSLIWEGPSRIGSCSRRHSDLTVVVKPKVNYCIRQSGELQFLCLDRERRISCVRQIA